MVIVDQVGRLMAFDMIPRRRRPIDDLFVIQNILVDAGEDCIDRLLAAHDGARSGVSLLAYTEHLAILMDFAREYDMETWRLRDCLSQMERGVFPRRRKLDPWGGNDQLNSGP